HRNGDHPFQEAAPQSGDPLGAVFAPEQELVAFGESFAAQACGEDAGGAGDVEVAVAPATVSIVIDQKGIGGVGDGGKEIEQGRVIGHLLTAWTWWRHRCDAAVSSLWLGLVSGTGGR